MALLAHEAAQAAELWKEYARSGSRLAREHLLALYAPLAQAIAKRMYRARIDDSVSFADYLQYGRVGLLEAVDRYDSSREVSFVTYSHPRIRGAILNGLARESEQAAQYRFWRQRSKQRIESLRTAVAAAADRASFAEIVVITAGLVVGALLDDLHGSSEPSDRNPHHDPYAANELRQLQGAVGRLIAQLPDSERTVIQGHYVEGKQFEVLARKLGLTRGRVSQLHAQALLRLRQWLDGRPRLDRKL